MNLAHAERDRNLETLQFISQQAAAHGLHFQLGLWMHGYEWANSPHANYTIEGLTAQNHGPYCRDALTALLRACPSISGVTFRVHGESGVTEGSYDFWKTVFDGVVRCGRKVDIDMHAKGIDQTHDRCGACTGHAGHGVAEILGGTHGDAVSPGRDSRAGDAARRTYGADGAEHRHAQLHALQLRRSVARGPQVQRAASRLAGHAAAADVGRSVNGRRLFARLRDLRIDGAEIMEPLSFKGRRGSGKPGGRCGYADASLNPRWDWQKYLRTYKVWGAALYDPDTRTASQGHREGAGERQPDLANGDDRAWSFGGEQYVLARDVHGAADGGPGAQQSVHRYAVAEDVR